MERQNDQTAKFLSSLGLLAAAVIWGGSFVFMKNSVDRLVPCYLLALRFSLAAAAMAVIFRSHFKNVTREGFIAGLRIGAALTVAYLLQTYGVFYTTASKNAFITSLYVIFVPFFSWVIFKRKPRRNHLAAGVLSVIGLAFLTLRGADGVNFGDFLTFLCGISFAVHLILQEQLTKQYDPVFLATMQVGVVGAANWVLAFVINGPAAMSPRLLMDRDLIFGLAFLVIFCTIIAYLIQTIGQKYVSANTAAILLSLETVFGTIFSVLFLHEVLTGEMIFGCVLMFAAILLAELDFDSVRKEAHG